MSYDLVISGGELVTPQGRFRADVAVEGERIAAVGLGLRGERTIDASGKLVLPGVIDVHVHFQLPFCGTVSADGFFTGSRSAALGGVTAFCDFAIQQGDAPLPEAVRARRAEADPAVCIDYGLHGAFTRWRGHEHELGELVEQGVPTFKMFMIYRSEGWQSTDADIFEALLAARRHGATVMLHAESDDLITRLQGRIDPSAYPGCSAHAATRPDVTEWEAVQRAAALAEATGGRLYIVHLSTGRAAQAIREARSRGVDAHAETCPQYLLLDDRLFARPDGHLYATCPPIRKPRDQEALWAALADGTLDLVATDTCTFTRAQKDLWEGDYRKIPFGLPGIETLLPLLHHFGVNRGRFSLEKLAELLSERPARLFGFWPRKGRIAPGADADLVVFDPALEVTIRQEELSSAGDYTPYEGMRVRGWPLTVLSRGRVLVEDREFKGEAGWGRFVHRRPHGR